MPSLAPLPLLLRKEALGSQASVGLCYRHVRSYCGLLPLTRFRKTVFPGS